MEPRCKHTCNKLTHSQNFITLKWPDIRNLQWSMSTSRGPSLISSRSLSLSGSTVGAQTRGVFFWGQERKNSCLEQFLHFCTTASSYHTPPSRRNREECTSSPLNTASAAPLGSHIPIRPSSHSQKNVVWGGWVKQDRGQRVGKSLGENSERQAEKPKNLQEWERGVGWGKGSVVGLWSWEQPTQNVWYVCCAPHSAHGHVFRSSDGETRYCCMPSSWTHAEAFVWVNCKELTNMKNSGETQQAVSYSSPTSWPCLGLHMWSTASNVNE